MLLKRAVFYGGAILLLAACSDVTAPKPQLQTKSVPSAAAKGPGVKKLDDPTTLDECRSGYFVSAGDKLVCADQLQPLP